MAQPKTTFRDKVASVLDNATEYMTIEEICKAAVGRAGDRERANTHLVIHRLGDMIEKRATAYRKKRRSG